MSKPKDNNLPAPAVTPKDSGKKKKEEKSEEEQQFESFMSEVESDLRDEAINNLWKNYGVYIVGTAVALVVGVFGYQLYNNYASERREQMAMAYADAAEAVDSGNFDDALSKLKAIEQVSGEGYSSVARLVDQFTFLDPRHHRS